MSKGDGIGAQLSWLNWPSAVHTRFPPRKRHNRPMKMLFRVELATALFALAWSTAAHTAPLLHCEVTYGGSTQTVDVRTVADPYPVPSVDVGGRFRFKAVMVGTAGQTEYIKLYAYVETLRQPVLVQQITYHPPFETGASLTGKQFLYAGVAERELQYECNLREVAP